MVPLGTRVKAEIMRGGSGKPDYRNLCACALYLFGGMLKNTQKSSIIITTNRPVQEWGKVFIDKRLATAIVDRLMHHHRLIEITGESWRHKHQD